MNTNMNADVVVVGTGAAALSAALSAHDAGASVAVIERADTVGGTTAVSGGGVWMPCNHISGAGDSREEAATYMTALSRGRATPQHIARFLAEGPDIVAGLERRSGVRFAPMTWPDYHPEMEGAKSTGRMMEPALFDSSRLGDWANRIRPAPVLGLPLTLQESTVDWRPSYTPERYDGAEVKRRSAANQVTCGTALIAGLLEGCLARGIEPMLGRASVRAHHAKWSSRWARCRAQRSTV